MIDSLRRHVLIAALAAVAVSSCANYRRGSAFWATVTDFRPNGGGVAATRAYADSLPYASMLLWIDGHARDLVVLGTVDADHRLTWVTADKQRITTYGPFIVATVGTEVELRRTEFGPGWSTDPRALVGKTLERTTVVAHRGEATVRLVSTFRAAGTATIKILGSAMPLQRIDEVVIANGRTEFLNSYWVDAAGATHKSRQEVLPTIAPVNIEIVKFPAQT